MINIKRAYDPALPEDGPRYLVDRLWPRGIARADLQIVEWLKDLAPSNELRKWFGHDPQRWELFCERYFQELDENPPAWKPLLEAARRADITLVYAARDAEHSNALALKQYLSQKL